MFLCEHEMQESNPRQRGWKPLCYLYTNLAPTYYIKDVLLTSLTLSVSEITCCSQRSVPRVLDFHLSRSLKLPRIKLCCHCSADSSAVVPQPVHAELPQGPRPLLPMLSASGT